MMEKGLLLLLSLSLFLHVRPTLAFQTWGGVRCATPLSQRQKAAATTAVPEGGKPLESPPPGSSSDHSTAAEPCNDGVIPSLVLPESVDVNRPNVKTADVLSLDSIRSTLIRQEETIIFGLIERAMFRQNTAIYTQKTFRIHKDGSPELFDRDASFLEYMLCETEKLHSRVRRYMSPEEQAFFPGFLPEPILPTLDFPQILAPNSANVNDQIYERYVSEVVPAVAKSGDDEQHGSTCLADITVLQALSRRIHLGKFVAESKYQEDGQLYRQLCKAGDVRGVNDLLTNKAVEKRVLERAALKASTYGQDLGGDTDSEETEYKVQPDVIAKLYRDLVIPLTKDVEIIYLFQRTGYQCPPLVGIHT